MPTPSEPEAARAARAAEKHARKGPGKAGPLPPCFCRRHITPPHCLSKVKTLNPRVFARGSRASTFAFGPCFPFILALWALLSFHFLFILAFWCFISVHFGLLVFHFCLFWPFGPLFPFILTFWAFVSFHFGLLGLHFLSFWPFGHRFPCILAVWLFLALCFGLLGFISLHFGLVGLNFLAVGPTLWHRANSVLKRPLTEMGFLLWIPPCGNDLTSSSDDPGRKRERRTILAHTHSTHRYFCSKHPRSYP